MNIVYLLLLTGSFSVAFSQQQLGNVYAGNTINSPAQIIQTNILVNPGDLNLDNNNNDNNPLQQQYSNYVSNIGNVGQTQQVSNKAKQRNDAISNGKGINLSFDFSSSSSSSSSGVSSKKTNRHAFQKRINKFNHNFYGKLASHKKSKHLVDVCFNWSK